MVRAIVLLGLLGLAAGYPALQDAFDALVVSSGSSMDSPRRGETGVAACLEPVKVGHCRGSIKRWAYDKNTARCRPFPWGGCGGSANNFRSETECQTQCAPLMDRPKRCIEKSFCPASCQLRTNPATGCQQCTCQAKAAGVCGLPKVTGPCKAAFMKYTYQASSGTCEPFLYGGCGGNGNNFETRQECERTCSGR